FPCPKFAPIVCMSKSPKINSTTSKRIARRTADGGIMGGLSINAASPARNGAIGNAQSGLQPNRQDANMAFPKQNDFGSEQASKAMLDGLTSRIREELRKRIMERIEPDIEAAVDASLSAFKATIESYRDPVHMRD